MKDYINIPPSVSLIAGIFPINRQIKQNKVDKPLDLIKNTTNQPTSVDVYQPSSSGFFVFFYWCEVTGLSGDHTPV